MPPKQPETLLDKLKSIQVLIACVIMGGAAYAGHAIAVHQIEELEVKVKHLDAERDVDHDILIELRNDVRHIKEKVDTISRNKESGK